MVEFNCFWSYQESLEETRNQLLYTTVELETLKMQVNQEMRKHNDQVKQLIDLVNIANKERDEAKDQLQKILNKLIPSAPESPLAIPIKANSSITESNSHNSLSDTYNHNSLNSSPVESFFDAVTSPDLSHRVNFVAKTRNQQQVPKMDAGDAAIERILRGKILPEKGKLLEAVLEAGPLLQTLQVAGPLPAWRNPPTASLESEIPPVMIGRKAGVDMWRGGSSQMCSSSFLSFRGPAAALAKRQRLH